MSSMQVPSRSGKTHGHRTKAELARDNAPSGSPEPVMAPPADPKWHPYARSWYNSLRMSGQAIWYEASDWATAMICAEQISRELSDKIVAVDPRTGDAHWGQGPVPGQSLNAILKMMAALVTTEGERRRARIELTRDDSEREQAAQILHLVREQEDEAFG